ncbi:MAG: chorismate synthase [Candidatus Omnitrophica bacterium]|nr:chorismate synthase [Candidatus Omnitrophota bacterium]
MPGNTFGNIFKITTFGESHGAAIGVIIDGVPPNIYINESDIQFELDRRKPGQSKVTTQRAEGDKVEILSGTFEGKTTGTPLTLVIFNKDQRPQDYSKLKDVFRPGHADYTYLKKYDIRDHRGSGRASGRETAARVAAGAIAKKILQSKAINIVAHTLSIGDIKAKKIDYTVIEKNIVRTADMDAAESMVKKIEEVKAKNDSIGGVIEAIVHNCPAGLGEPVFDKLDAVLAHSLMSIGSVKGIEFGSGFKCSEMLGSEHNDKIYLDGKKVRTRPNNSGGILGGISNGEDIIIRLAIKPTSSIAQSQQTITTEGKPATIMIEGRHDPCLCPRIVPVAEAMIAITILDFLLLQKVIDNSIA